MRPAVVRLGLVLCLLAAVVVVSAVAGDYVPPPGDGGPVWVSDGALLFRSGSSLMAIGADGVAPPQVVATVSNGPLFSGLRVAPTLPLLAYEIERGGNDWLAVSATDGSGERLLVAGDYQPIAWSSDSGRIFFGPSSGEPDWSRSRISSIGADGTGLFTYPRQVHGIPSPNGKWFAYNSPNDDGILHLVSADGSDERTLGGGASPVWSPDSSQLAFWRYPDLAVARIGGATRRFSLTGTVTNGTIAWSPNGQSLYADSYHGIVKIDLHTGKLHTIDNVWPVSDVTVSPDGTRIAYAAGGECRDRIGIYVAHSDGSNPTRLSNSCRVVGTDGPDVLHGSFSQVVIGLGGNDTLYADDSYYYFDGNTLIGGPGNDTLIGGYGTDILYGGPGNDMLDGGEFADILVGGPGHDHINGGTGNDLIGAQDGERDWITCGTSGPGSGVHEHDVVYADKIDIVAPDCEIVHRR
jgi:hypothetical protein